MSFIFLHSLCRLHNAILLLALVSYCWAKGSLLFHRSRNYLILINNNKSVISYKSYNNQRGKYIIILAPYSPRALFRSIIVVLFYLYFFYLILDLVIVHKHIHIICKCTCCFRQAVFTFILPS